MGASKDSVVSSRLKREDCKRTKHDSVFSEWKVSLSLSLSLSLNFAKTITIMRDPCSDVPKTMKEIWVSEILDVLFWLSLNYDTMGCKRDLSFIHASCASVCENGLVCFPVLVLIGPSDWEDHSLGKEGAERYRIHNLPNCASCSGLYELGIVVLHTRSGRETSKFDPDHIIPVYVGQADNVRTRLQCYGREGAHLENGKSTGELNDSVLQGRGLFSEIFSRGYSVVYRWAPLRDGDSWYKGLVTPLGKELEDAVRAKFPHAKLSQGYGMTEADQNRIEFGGGRKIEERLKGPTMKPMAMGAIVPSEPFLGSAAVAYTVYTKAKMKNKRDAEKTEAQVLDTFDYAWNKGGNGVRRPNDILKKLDRSTSRNTKFHVIVKKLQTFRQKKMGIKIEACKPLPWENVSNTYSYQENNDLFSRIFKIGRSQPRLVQLRHGFNEDYASICGVALGHGSVCRRLPVEGRKRCAEHKGLKINGNHLKVEYRASSFSHDTMKPQLVVDDCPVGKDSFPICGVALDDGILCRRQPVRGRKRCEEHKGRKITKSFSESRTKNKQGHLCDPILESSTYGYDSEKILSKTRKMGTTCGVGLKDGTFCIRQPALGKKRCEEHKRMKIIGSKSKLLVADVPNVFDCSGINSCSGQKV
ncbi:hypothetical protein TEA_017535 [Camellia sinensis var. sinensis]|uniref:GIY-YIG domain-containing protein n=1 Tax=Camellia sinensis var. sinensis TaxID=542762 RepID=A0A4S4DBQ3_CAMSN|nr:hypothetical protein TEA_017535 [Camellia sinensis var. sinensis]